MGMTVRYAKNSSKNGNDELPDSIVFGDVLKLCLVILPTIQGLPRPVDIVYLYEVKAGARGRGQANATANAKNIMPKPAFRPCMLC